MIVKSVCVCRQISYVGAAMTVEDAEEVEVLRSSRLLSGEERLYRDGVLHIPSHAANRRQPILG